MSKTHEELLTDYLSDAYSIEQQALAQLVDAPEIAGEPALAEMFSRHHAETERQAERVHARLEAHGGSPRRLKDAVMALGGKGFLLFARVQPDTPGKLTAHAHSYEALEWASYEMLVRMAERAGDEATAQVARAIRDEERTMMERLEASFDRAAEASLQKIGRDDLSAHVKTYLADAHALEVQAVQLFEKGEEIAGVPELARLYREHLAQSRQHGRWIEARLDELGGDTSTVKDAALRMGGLNWGFFFQAQTDTPGKLAVFAYALENLEIAGYELLWRVAERASDSQTADLARRILADERTMAANVAQSFDRAFQASLEAQGVAVA